MIDIQIEADDLEAIYKLCDRLQRPDLYQGALTRIANDIWGKASKYPLETAANRPPYPYYKRGTGTMYGPGSTDNASEKLNTRWYATVFPSYVEIGNRATYAGYVHGPDQVPIFGERGWKKLLDVATAELPELLRKIADNITRIWEGRQ